MAGTTRGAPIFAVVVESWKSGRGIASNTEIGARLSWTEDEVAEGFRLVRKRLELFSHPSLTFQLRRYHRDLVVRRKHAADLPAELVVSVPRAKNELLGPLMAGVRRATTRHSLHVIAEQPSGPEEEAMLGSLEKRQYLVMPCEDADDHGLFARLDPARAVLLDLAVTGCDLACATFDYVGAGLECTNELLGRGCTEVIVLASEPDRRVREIAAGYRRAMRNAGRSPRAVLGIASADYLSLSRAVEERLGLLQEAEILKAAAPLGIVCAGAELGHELLRQLDGREHDGLVVGVAVVGGRPWPARHWTEPFWAELNYEQLGEKAAAHLLREGEGLLARVPATYRKGPGRVAGVLRAAGTA